MRLSIIALRGASLLESMNEEYELSENEPDVIAFVDFDFDDDADDVDCSLSLRSRVSRSRRSRSTSRAFSSADLRVVYFFKSGHSFRNSG